MQPNAQPTQAPVCHGRKMIAVVSRTTSANAYSKQQDTPVWWCPDCGRQIKREVEATGPGVEVSRLSGRERRDLYENAPVPEQDTHA